MTDPLDENLLKDIYSIVHNIMEEAKKPGKLINKLPDSIIPTEVLFKICINYVTLCDTIVSSKTKHNSTIH